MANITVYFLGIAGLKSQKKKNNNNNKIIKLHP